MNPTNHDHIDPRKRAPPGDFPFAADMDDLELEAEFQQALNDEDNRERLREFEQYDPDGPSASEIEEAEKYFRESPDEQQRMETFMDDYNASEAIQRESPFWQFPHITRETSSAPSCVQESQVAPSDGSQSKSVRQIPSFLPAQHSVVPSTEISMAPLMDAAKAHEKRPDAYSVASWLIKNAHIALCAGILYFYTGKAYLPKRAPDAKRMIMELCRPVIKATGNPRLIQDIYTTLMLEPRICRDTEINGSFVAFDDGILDVDSMRFFPHSPDIFVTTQLKASYISGLHQDCPVFKRFLSTVCRGDCELERRIWEALGFLLAPNQAGKSFILFQGVPNSGKSLLGNFIRRCFEGDVVSALELNELQGNFVLSDLIGKKLCFDFDLPADPFSKKAIGRLKKLTGADEVSSDVKFNDRVRFLNTAKFLFATNHRVILHGDDDAFFDRLVVIPFAVAVDKANQDFHLSEKLDRERSAIIVQALRHYQALARNNFIFAGDFQLNEAGAANSGDSVIDCIADFLQASCEQVEDGWIPTDALYSSFVAKYGTICSKNTFSRLLLQICQSSGINVKKHRHRTAGGGNPVYGFSGLKFKEENYGKI